MTDRPRIDPETTERVNEKLRDVMRVDPEGTGMDKKINILLDELNETEAELRRERSNIGGNQQGVR